MNSLIISVMSNAFCALLAAFKKSAAYRIFMRIYGAFSRWWKDSVIMSGLRKETFCGISGKSILHKVIYLPFSIFDIINKKYGRWISKTISDSIIIRLSKCFFNNILSLNTRFLGCMILSMLIVRELISMQFSALTAVLAVIGIIFTLLSYNITAFFEKSKVVEFCLKTIGFSNISWEFYDERENEKLIALVIAVVCGAVMGAISLWSILLAFLIPAAFVGLCLVLSCPLSGVIFAAFIAPFAPTMVLAAMCALTFFALVIKSVSNKDFKWKLEGVGVGLGFFLVFMLASCIFSFAPARSLMVWGMYLIFVGFYFVIINTVETKEQLYSVLKIFVIAGCLVSLYGVLQYIFGWNTTNAWIDEEMFEEATMRAYSTMENPNVLGEYLLLLIPLAAVFMIKAKRWSLEQLFFAGTLGVSLLCMIFTQSRGCWLGLMLAAVVFVTFYNGKLWGLLPIALVILPFVIPDTMVDRLMSVGNLEDSSTSYRVFIWLGTFEMLKDFWVGGIGMGEGAFRSVYPLYSYNAIVAPHSHNTFLQLLVEGGVAALSIFVVTMIVFIKKMSTIYIKNAKNSLNSLLALAIGSGVLGFLLQSMFDYTFYNYRMMAMFFMILAFGVSIGFVKEDVQSEDN